jgi:hypothetical protein
VLPVSVAPRIPAMKVLVCVDFVPPTACANTVKLTQRNLDVREFTRLENASIELLRISL